MFLFLGLSLGTLIGCISWGLWNMYIYCLYGMNLMIHNCESLKSDFTVLLGQVEIPVSPEPSISHAEHLLPVTFPFSIS